MRLRPIGLVLCGLLSGCSVGSIGPYYSPSQVQFDSTLLGTWTDSDSHARAVFSRMRDQYDISYTERDGKTAHFVGRLFRLDGATAMDISAGMLPDSLKDCLPDVYWSSTAPLHSLWWIDLRGDRLGSAMFDEDTLKAWVGAHPAAVPHVFDGDRLILTAGPEQLQTFVLEYRKRSGVMAASTIWWRSR